MKKLKTYVITVSERFPAYHNRKGQQTCFISLINDSTKKHTVRSNYELWRKRFVEVENGRACISIRIWTGKPYVSPQQEIKQLTSLDGIGIQKLRVHRNVRINGTGIIEGAQILKNEVFVVDDLIYTGMGDQMHGYTESYEEFCGNDGMTVEDFREWFKKADISKPMAIIHFTNFRY